MSTSRIVSLASALIMLLALETAILAKYNNGMDRDNLNKVIIGCTGIAIALTILGLSLYKIIKSVRILRKIKNKQIEILNESKWDLWLMFYIFSTIYDKFVV